MRAQCMIREALVYRREVFLHGLQEAGYSIVPRIDKPSSDDVLVIWNRYGKFDMEANRFEHAGARVIVVENGYLGKVWMGARWFALAIGQHAGGGQWKIGSNDRWDEFGFELAPFRANGSEAVILGQRGIGSPEVRSPDGWSDHAQRLTGGRIRRHPGNHEPSVPLEDDLARASSVVTWASSAAFQALILGVPVWYEYPKWIGGLAGRPLSEFGQEPKRDVEDRLNMFRRLVWAMWREEEIRDGLAFSHLLG